MVMSHLPKDRSADLLACLPARMQAEVARRLVDLEEADPEVVRDVERGLQSWLEQQDRNQQRRKAGLATLEGILQAADESTQHEILANLGIVDRRLARDLPPPRRRASHVCRCAAMGRGPAFDPGADGRR